MKLVSLCGDAAGYFRAQPEGHRKKGQPSLSPRAQHGSAKCHIPALKNMRKSMFDQGGTAGKCKQRGSNFQTGIWQDCGLRWLPKQQSHMPLSTKRHGLLQPVRALRMALELYQQISSRKTFLLFADISSTQPCSSARPHWSHPPLIKEFTSS